jgi:hypothetical protein
MQIPWSLVSLRSSASLRDSGIGRLSSYARCQRRGLRERQSNGLLYNPAAGRLTQLGYRGQECLDEILGPPGTNSLPADLLGWRHAQVPALTPFSALGPIRSRRCAQMFRAEIPILGVSPTQLCDGVEPDALIERLLCAGLSLHRHADLPSALVAHHHVAIDGHTARSTPTGPGVKQCEWRSRKDPISIPFGRWFDERECRTTKHRGFTATRTPAVSARK